MANKIGVAGLPGLVATLEAEGLEVVTGTDFRDAARNIRQAQSTSDGFPVLVGDIDGGDPSLSAWVQMTARNVPVTVIRLRGASGVAVDDIAEHQAPVGLGDVLIGLDLPFPSDAAFTTVIQSDGVAVSENGQQQPSQDAPAAAEHVDHDTPLVTDHTPPPAPSRSEDPWADQASEPTPDVVVQPEPEPEPVPVAAPSAAVTPPPVPSRSNDPWATPAAPVQVSIPDPEEVESFAPEPADSPEPATAASAPQVDQDDDQDDDDLEDFDFGEPAPAPALAFEPAPVEPAPVPAPVIEEARSTIPGTPVTSQPRHAIEPDPTPEPDPVIEQTPVVGPEPAPTYTPSWERADEQAVAPAIPDRGPMDDIDDILAEATPSSAAPGRRRGGRRGDTIVAFAAKGGVGKTTIAITLAQYAAVHGPEDYRVVLVDGNRGQGDVRSNLRVRNRPIPSIYDAVAKGPAAAVASPQTLAQYRNEMWGDIDFALVAAPPSDLADPGVVTHQVYRDTIEYAQSIADLVIIDTQIAEAYDTSALFDQMLVPMLASSAWGVGLTDTAPAAPGNLVERIQNFGKDGVTRDRLMIAINRADTKNDTAESLDALATRMSGIATHVGTLWYDDVIGSQMKLGMPPIDQPALARMLSTTLFRVTALAEFDPARLDVPDEERVSFLSRFKRLLKKDD